MSGAETEEISSNIKISVSNKSSQPSLWTAGSEDCYLNDLQFESLSWIFVLNVEVEVAALLARLPRLVRVEREQSEGAVLEETQLKNTSEGERVN